MIYLDNTSIRQTVYVPRRGLDGYTVSASLRFVSTIDLTEFVVAVQDQSTSPLYFLVTFQLPLEVQERRACARCDLPRWDRTRWSTTRWTPRRSSGNTKKETSNNIWTSRNNG